jgi:enoyl-CoA hydratase/carnithine racemase
VRPDEFERWLCDPSAPVASLDDVASAFGLSFDAPAGADAGPPPHRFRFTLAVLRDTFPDDGAVRRWLRAPAAELGGQRPLDLLLSGRVVLGEEAAALGLVNRALPGDQLLDETLAYARDMATNCSPASMAAMKRQVYADLEHGVAESLAEADRQMLASFERDDFREGVASFVERREPRFAPLATPQGVQLP